MRNTEDVSDNSSVSDIRNRKAINSVSKEMSADKEKLLASAEPEAVDDQDEAKKRKKKYMYIGFGILGGIAIILAIVLPLTLGGHKDPPRPDPIGPNPLPPGVMNPY